MADGVSEERQRAYFERTKKGVLRWLADQGGSAPMREMHDYSAEQVPRRSPGLLQADGGLRGRGPRGVRSRHREPHRRGPDARCLVAVRRALVGCRRSIAIHLGCALVRQALSGRLSSVRQLAGSGVASGPTT